MKRFIESSGRFVASHMMRFLCLSCILITLPSCMPVMVAGVATSAALELTKDQTTSSIISDISIANSIKARLAKKNFRALYSRVTVLVRDGRVFLAGNVESQANVLSVLGVAWSQKGVKEVINEIQVTSDSNQLNLTQYLRDSLTTSTVKSKTFLAKKLKFTNYTICTMNDIVYLFGVTNSRVELETVARIASEIRWIKKVVSYVVVNDTKYPKQKKKKRAWNTFNKIKNTFGKNKSKNTLDKSNSQKDNSIKSTKPKSNISIEDELLIERNIHDLEDGIGNDW